MEVTLGVEIGVALAIAVLAVAWPVWRYWQRRGIWAPKGSKPLPEHGDVFKSHIFGSPYVFFRGSEAAKLVITGEGKLVHAHQILPARKLLGEESLVTVHGPKHKLYRKVFNEVFMGEGVRKYLPVVEQATLETLTSWKLGDVPVIKDEATKLTFHVIAGVVLSWGPGPVRDKSLELTEIVGGNLLSVPINLPGFAFHKAMQARTELGKMYDTEFALRRSGKFVRNDMLNDIINAVHPDSASNKPALDDEQLRDNLVTIIWAGHETTTKAITWLVKLLHENPSVKDKLLAEHLAVRSNKQAGEPLMGGSRPTYDLHLQSDQRGTPSGFSRFLVAPTGEGGLHFQRCRRGLSP